MTKLYCADCRSTFDEDEAETCSECVGEFWGSPAYTTNLVCPNCGSDCLYDAKLYEDDEDGSEDDGEE